MYRFLYQITSVVIVKLYDGECKNEVCVCEFLAACKAILHMVTEKNTSKEDKAWGSVFL